MIFHRIIFGGAIRHTFLACVEPREGRLDTVGCIIGKGQRDSAGGGNGEQVAVADAVLTYLVLDLIRQARGEARFGQILIRIEQRKCATLYSQVHRSEIRFVAHDARNVGCERARLFGIVTQAQHH